MGKKGQISVSMMCVGIANTLEYLRIFEEAKIEYLHIDVMDGAFVPNITLGTDYVRQLRALTTIPFDFHFMVDHPEEKIKWFDIRPGDFAAVHYESEPHLNKCLQYIRSLGAKPLIALNPATPLCVLEESLDYIDGVLIMSVNPGFAGQKLVESTVDKVRRLKKLFADTGHGELVIQTDGNMSVENAKRFYDAGTDIFIAGTSSIIKPDTAGAAQRIAQKRSVIGWE
ncbi:MAG: ribulose-phosphate 3-epimerase [Oscillospiraceae bacterium]